LPSGFDLVSPFFSMTVVLLLLLLLLLESEFESEPESVPEENDSEVSSEICPSGGERDKGHDAALARSASFLATMSGIFFSHGFLIMLETGAWTTWTTASGPG
jgi:hypothetical protein